MLLTVGAETFEMRRIDAAAGAVYEAVEDHATALRNNGDGSIVPGRMLPRCI